MRRAVVLSVALLVALAIWAVYQVGWQEKQVINFVADASASIKSLQTELLGDSLASGLKAKPLELKHIDIFIKPDAMKTLYQKRQHAMTIYFREKAEDDFVPAIVSHNGVEYNVRMRLKGDLVDHLEPDKWSFRFEVKGDNAIMGMKRFSIQHPKTRSYLYDWIYFQFLKREGLIALRYDFITASLNGKPLGIYALEESFEKRLIENNGRRDGPIVRLNEDVYWWALINKMPDMGYEANAASIDSFDTNAWTSEPELREIHNQALDLLESFRSGKVKTSEAFDIEQLARFYGVCEIMGNDHSRYWNNLRYYFNPITSKFEPIGYDASIGSMHKPLVINDVATFPNNLLFADAKLVEAYLRVLRRMAKPEYLESFYSEIGPELDQLEATLQTEWPDYSFDRKSLWDNQSHFGKALDPDKAINVYWREFDAGELALDIGNIMPFPVVVTGVKWGQSTITLPEPVTIPSKYRYDAMKYETVKFQVSDQLNREGVGVDVSPKVVYHLIGLDEDLKEVESFPWGQEPGYLGAEIPARQDPTFHEFDFISVDENARLISIMPGEHRLTKDLIIPEGYTVICGDNTEIDLCNSSLIFSYSPLIWSGSETSPIVFTTSDGTGQGLVVMNPRGESRLTYVVFDQLTFPNRQGWSLTGGVTFYGAKVDMRHVAFNRIQAEDGLNLVRSEFVMQNVRFEFCMSDAFDADFCKGEVNECYFLNPGNDGIDVSGGSVMVKSTLIDKAGDKGISSGEGSLLQVYGVTIQRSEIAMASKDKSEITGDENVIKDCKVGLTAFRKKPEFGSSLIRLYRTQMTSVQNPTLIEKGSELEMDGVATLGELINVESMLYGAQFGKASER